MYLEHSIYHNILTFNVPVVKSHVCTSVEQHGDDDEQVTKL